MIFLFLFNNCFLFCFCRVTTVLGIDIVQVTRTTTVLYRYNSTVSVLEFPCIYNRYCIICTGTVQYV